MDHDKWIEAGERMGLTGSELQEYVEKREKEFLDREERMLRREDEKSRLEFERLKLEEERLEKQAVALPRIETERFAEALLDVFSSVGFPTEILSDEGSQFTSDLMKEVCRLISLKQLFTTPYNPKCNGLCERMNGVLKSMLKKMCQ